MKFRFLEENGAVVLQRRLWDERCKGSNSGKGECFFSSSNLPDRLWGTHSHLVNMYKFASAGIKRPGREPNNSPPSSAEAMMLSKRFR